MPSHNEITGDKLITKVPNNNYRNKFDDIDWGDLTSSDEDLDKDTVPNVSTLNDTNEESPC